MAYLVFTGALGVFYFVNRLGPKDQDKPLRAFSPILIIILVISGAVLWSNPNFLLKRISYFEDFQKFIENAQRVRTYRATLKMVKDFPVVGAGLGTFPNLYFKYRGAELANSIYAAAHSDYLQLQVETGLIGSGIIFILISFYLFFIVSRHSKDKRFPQRLIGTGMIAGISTMLFHSFVGFNIHIPANALLFSEICGFTYILIQKQ